MAATLTLQNSINFAQPILKNQPLLISNQEPALTMGNIILLSILGPPMKWRFNRNTFDFAISTALGTDYAISIPDLGFIEVQWLTDSSGNVHQIDGAERLARPSSNGRPARMAPQYDNGAGNITFRFDRTPDQNYNVFGDYQKKAILMSSAGSPWGVVPDEFEYIYNQGFLALAMLINNDSRFPIFEQYFLSRLLGAQDGLTDQERDIFLGNWTRSLQTVARSQASVIGGAPGRAPKA